MPDFTLYYWPIPFRGHFVRYVLAQAGAEWEEAGFERTQAMKASLVTEQPCPTMAPPILHDHSRNQYMCQMPAIVMALGRRFELDDDPDQALRLICDACDMLLEITCSHGQQMWSDKTWRPLVTERLPRWMQIHDRIVRESAQGDEPFLSRRGEPGLSDLMLTALWHTMTDRLPQLRPVLDDHGPALADLTDRVARQPKIARFLTGWSECTPLYCGGQIEASLIKMLAAPTGR